MTRQPVSCSRLATVSSFDVKECRERCGWHCLSFVFSTTPCGHTIKKKVLQHSPLTPSLFYARLLLLVRHRCPPPPSLMCKNALIWCIVFSNVISRWWTCKLGLCCAVLLSFELVLVLVCVSLLLLAGRCYRPLYSLQVR